MKKTRFSALFVALAFVAGTAQLAHAQDIEKQVSRMNKKAMEDYDSLEFDSARKTLVDAISMLRANGVDETPLAAKTYINLGIVYISGFKDVNRGKQQFVNALKINPEAHLDPALATPELEEAFDAARKQAGVKKPPKREEPPPPPPKREEPPPPQPKKNPPPPKREEPPPPPPKREEPPPPPPKKEEPPPPPAEPEPPSPDEVKGLQHNPVDEVRPNAPVVVKALLGSDVGATKLFLFFRGTGQEDYVSLAMKHTKGAEYVAQIPGEATSGRALQYYLEARDARGRAVVGSGSAPNPYIISVSESAAPSENLPEVAVEEDEALKARLRRQREEEEKKSGKFHRLFLFVMPGIGLGYEPGGNVTEVSWQLQNPGGKIDPAQEPDANKRPFYSQQSIGAGGFAIAPFHLTVEFGGMITKGFGLSLVGRFQVVTGANAESVKTNPNDTLTSPVTKATGAVAGLIRARYRFLDGKFHPYVHVGIGYGQIRHMLDVSSAQSTDHPLVDKYSANAYNNPIDDATTMAKITTPPEDAFWPHQQVCSDHNSCRDSVVITGVMLGGGAGIWYDVHKYVAFIFDVNLLGVIGVGGQSGMNIDIQLGIGAHFL